MNKLELVKIFYESARDELIHRIRLRDNVLMLYLGFSGTIFGLALNSNFSDNSFAILLVIPFLALGVSVILAQHNGAIASIGEYCGTELEKTFDDLIKPEKLSQWDNSASLHNFSQKAILWRSWGHFFIIFIPAFTALAVNWKIGIYSPFPIGVIWWFGILCLAIAIYFIITIHSWRKTLYDKRNWKK